MITIYLGALCLHRILSSIFFTAPEKIIKPKLRNTLCDLMNLLMNIIKYIIDKIDLINKYIIDSLYMESRNCMHDLGRFLRSSG